MRPENMTIEDLVAEYNRHGPVEPLERWDGSRDELVQMVRIAGSSRIHTDWSKALL